MTARAVGLILAAGTAASLAGGAVAMSARPKSTCQSEQYQDLVGQTWQDSLLPEREAPVRVLHPDSMMTMDHRPDRLNIQVDADGKVTGLRCG